MGSVIVRLAMSLQEKQNIPQDKIINHLQSNL